MPMKMHVLVIVLMMVSSTGLCDEPKRDDFSIDDHLGPSWYGAYVYGKRYGYALTTGEKTTYDGKPAYKYSMELVMVLTVEGKEHRAQVKLYQTFYASGSMAEKCTTIVMDGERQSYHGVVTGDMMTIKSSIEGVDHTRTVPAPSMTLEDQFAVRRLVLSNPQSGTSVTEEGYDLEDAAESSTVYTMKGRKTLLLDGKETSVFEVEAVTTPRGTQSTKLFDEEGSMLRSTMPFDKMTQTELRRETEETADTLNIDTVFVSKASMLVRPKGEMPPYTAQRLRLRITGMEDRDVLSDNHQHFEKVADKTWLVTLKGDALPADPATLPAKEPGSDEFLKSTERYQSDHPEIVAKAKQIVGGERNPVRVNKAICMWVFDNLKKERIPGFPNAVGTLRKGSGDCGRHTALFVALCRAAGLPARGITGLAYHPKIAGFGAHAWAEVFVGRWVPVDPTFGEPIANSARIKLCGDGALEMQRALDIPEKMTIEVVTVDGERAQ